MLNIKNVLLVFTALMISGVSSASFARDLTLTEIYLTRKTEASGMPHLIAQDTLALWCAGLGNGVDFGSFASARAIERLRDGLYRCKGEFVNTPARSRIQMFNLESCEAQSATELKKFCP